MIPPLIGFFSKQFVLYSAIESGYYFMAIVAILVSIISASYYLKIIRVLHTESSISNIAENITNEHNYSLSLTEKEGYENDSIKMKLPAEPLSSSSTQIDQIKTNPISSQIEIILVPNQQELLLTNFHSFLISSLTLSILLFVIKPSIILNSTQLLSLSLYNY